MDPCKIIGPEGFDYNQLEYLMRTKLHEYVKVCFPHLYHQPDQIRGFPRLHWMSSMGDEVDEEGVADAVEDVIEEDLCGWVMELVLLLVFAK